MQILTTQSALKAATEACIAKHQSVGLVPTMGALHAGHASLIERSVKENDITVVSVFVNPTQFNNKEDLLHYPRTLERDSELLRKLHVDYLFAPTPEEMYTQEELNATFQFDFGGLDKVMEGKMRPGHFNGVVQIVSRLFDLVAPTRAYFGEKDFQQLAIIRHLVRTKHYDIQIVGCPIVREESGLALSSRNERLSADERKTAVNISRILFESKALTATHTVQEVQDYVVRAINSVEGLEVEYYEIVDADTLQPADSFANAVGCVTVYCGEVRLIDNIHY